MLEMATNSANECRIYFSMPDGFHRKDLDDLSEACEGRCRGRCCNVQEKPRLNIQQCNQVRSEIHKFAKLFQARQHAENPAVQEFWSIAESGLDLLEVCSTDRWLLKAVEIGDCPEDFVEFHLDLYWSSNVLNLACQKIGLDIFLDNLRGLWRLDNSHFLDRMVLEVGEQNNQGLITKVHELREKDKQSLISRVNEMLEADFHGGCPVDYQLAKILKDRNGCFIPYTPPDLEKHVKSWKFNIISSVKFFKLGQGGSSFVVRYRWVYKKEFVLKLALKSSEGYDEIKEEAKIMEKCRHPYIVGVVGCWEINSKSLMLMESMKCTLTELMNRSRTSGGREGFPPSKAIDLMLPVAKAIRYLHGKENPIAHRDIKPDNVMCYGKLEDATKLIDFGHSVEFDPGNATRKYGVAGTYGYMDPEVRKCPQFSDLLKADVYSFGMVFWELLTWKTPEEALCARAGKSLGRSEVNGLLERGWRPLVPGDIPIYVTFIIESCWRKSPLSRPGFGDICLMLQNAQLLLKELKICPVEEELAMVSYTDSDGVDWPIAGKSTLKEMLNMEDEETYRDDILQEILRGRRSSEDSRKRQKLDDVGTSRFR